MQDSKEVAKDIQRLKAQPSITALSVVGGFVRGLDTEYGHLFKECDLALAKHIYYSAIKADPNFIRRNLVNAFTGTFYSFQSWFLETTVKPGYDVHMVGRKKLVRDSIEQAIGEGAKHIIILGGGYDPRAFLASQEYPEVKFYELDRGDTRNIKIHALKNLPDHLQLSPPKVTIIDNSAVQFNDNLLCIECDFITDDLEATLTCYGYQAGEETFVIGEGLTMYLTLKNIQQLLTSLSQLFSHKSRFLVSFLPSISEIGSIHQTAINSTKEEYTASLKPEEVIPFVKEQGFQVKGKLFGEEIQIAFGNHKVVELEHKNAKMGKENYYLLQPDPENEGIKTIDEVPNLTLVMPSPEEITHKADADDEPSSMCRFM